MSIKPSEQFHSTLIAQYKDMVHEALLECDHKLSLDEELFDKKIHFIIVAAKIDGLTKQDIFNLVEEAKMEISDHSKVG